MMKTRYEDQLFVMRQYGLLLEKGHTPEQAVHLVEQNISNPARIKWLKQLIGTEPGMLPEAGPGKALNRLLKVSGHLNLDKIQLFKSFYNRFLRKNEVQFISNFDTSGLLIYLIALITIISIVTSIYVVFVYPSTDELFAEVESGIPPLTGMLMNLFKYLGGPLIVLVVAVLGYLFYAVMKIKRSMQNLELINGSLQYIPGINKLLTGYNDYLFLNFSKILTESGMEPEQAVSLVENEIFNASRGKSNFISENTPESKMLLASRALETISDEIDYQISRKRDAGIEEYARFKEVISTAALLIVATMIGTLIIAMYLPIFQMGKVIGG